MPGIAAGTGGLPAETGGLPAGTRLVLAAGTRRIGPGLLAGGRPLRVLRLSPAGDRWIDRWATGQVVPGTAGARMLARRLVDGGLASPRPPPDPDASVTVVVPCRDRAAGLATTLGALGPDFDVIVVDDGSVEPASTERVVDRRLRTTLIRRPASGGPAAARNTGWRVTDSDLVAFVDSECVAPPGWAAALAGHFGDPAVGAVAPRIVPLPVAGALPVGGAQPVGARPVGARPVGDRPVGGRDRLSAYEAVRSPLDLGPDAAPVRPRSTVPYVPTAVLVVRRAALSALGGFDEELGTGEDVDLVWRLHRAGWAVRYDPDVVVGHPVRPTAVAWWRQRVGYGRAAAPLAARHGRAVAPLAVSRWSAAAWSLVALGHPLLGAAVTVAATARTVRRSGGAVRLPSAEITRLALRSHLDAGRGIADAGRRAWWPLLGAAAVFSRRARWIGVVVVVVPALLERHRRRPDLDALTWTALRLADDLAYGAGVWSGAIRARRIGSLLPDLS